jgi:CubicO group peptidase (beta-lactamase class C family)
MSYEEFVQNRLVDPLEMNNTFAGVVMKDKSNLAIPHSSESGTIKQIDL